MIEFFMPMQPPTATGQEREIVVRNGKPGFYNPDRVKAARAKLTANLAKHTPKNKLTGPLELVTKWCFSPMNRNQHNGDYRISRPDTDNLQKLLKDCMTQAGFWKDDAQVCREITEKFWADIPGIYIRIREL